MSRGQAATCHPLPAAEPGLVLLYSYGLCSYGLYGYGPPGSGTRVALLRPQNSYRRGPLPRPSPHVGTPALLAERAGAVDPAPCYGLHSYGLHSYGLHSYGLHSYGPPGSGTDQLTQCPERVLVVLLRWDELAAELHTWAPI